MNDEERQPRRDRSTFYLTCALVIGFGALAVWAINAFFAYLALGAPRH